MALSTKTDHLRLRIPGRGELTLSLPDGLVRALRENRLPASVEAWHAAREMWVPLAAHPSAIAALETIGLYTGPAPGGERPSKPEPVVEEAPGQVSSEPAPEVPGNEEPAAPDSSGPTGESVQEERPADPAATEEPEAAPAAAAPPQASPLLESATPPSVASPTPPATSEEAARPPAPLPPPRPRPSAAAPVDRKPRESTRRPPVAPPPPAPEEVPAGWLARLKAEPRQLILLGLCLLAGGLVLWSRLGPQPSVPAPAPGPAAAASPAAGDSALPRDTTPPEAAPVAPVSRPVAAAAEPDREAPPLRLQGVPGAGPESDLETRLELADALVWDPEDFASPDAVLRSRRKVDAVVNSIAAYRVDLRRFADSAGAPAVGNRMEPYEEASRINDVLRAMGRAVAVLEEYQGQYQVRGGAILFHSPDAAARYNRLREEADSLLRAPVELDPNPVVRPPRRYVSRLLASFPAGLNR